MRLILAIAALLTCIACTRNTSGTRPAEDYAVYYRGLSDKKSWVLHAGRLVFDRTEVLLLDSSGGGFRFSDTASPECLGPLLKSRLSLIRNHPNLAYLKDYGLVKLVKKELANGEKYFVLSNDSSRIIVYRIVADSLPYSFSCELYGSHDADSSSAANGFHAGEQDRFTFKKFP